MYPKLDNFFDLARWLSEAVRWGMLQADFDELLRVVLSDARMNWSELSCVRELKDRMNRVDARQAADDVQIAEYQDRIEKAAAEEPRAWTPLGVTAGSFAAAIGVIVGVGVVVWTGWEPGLSPTPELSALVSLTCASLLLMELRQRSDGGATAHARRRRVLPGIVAFALILLVIWAGAGLTPGAVAFGIVAALSIVVGITHIRTAGFDVWRQTTAAYARVMAALFAKRAAWTRRTATKAQARYEEWEAALTDQLKLVGERVAYEYQIGTQCGLWQQAAPVKTKALQATGPLSRTNGSDTRPAPGVAPFGSTPSA